MRAQPKEGDNGIYPVDVSLTSSELVYGLINHDNETNHSALTLRLGIPFTNPDPQYNRNTKIKAMSTPGAPRPGSTYFWYDRLSLDQYLQNHQNIVIPVSDGMKTMQDAVEWFNTEFELGLVKDDVKPDVINFEPNAVNKFTISSTSLAWQGSVNVRFEVDKIDIGTVVGNENLDCIHVASATNTVYGELYGYAVDTKDIGVVLYQTPTAELTEDTLAKALTSASGDFWAYDEKQSVRNLYKADVTFNGRVTDQVTHKGKPNYEYMMLVQPNDLYCVGFQGPLVLYYNHTV